MRIQLKRVCANLDGTMGVLLVDNKPFCVTLEEEQGGNKKDTAIPAGNYRVTPHSGPKFQNAFILHDVPGRSAILIHWGNTEDHTAGCILLGRQFGKLAGKCAVLESWDAFKAFRGIAPQDFILEITDHF